MSRSSSLIDFSEFPDPAIARSLARLANLGIIPLKIRRTDRMPSDFIRIEIISISRSRKLFLRIEQTTCCE